MKDSEIITFSFEGHGKFEFTVARCREICPRETAALEEAVEEMALASEGQDLDALAKASGKVGRRVDLVKQAIVAAGRRRETEQNANDPTNQG